MISFLFLLFSFFSWVGSVLKIARNPRVAQSQVDLSSSVRFSATNKRKYQRRIREQELLRVNPRHSSPASKTMPLASDCRRGNEDPGLGAAALINTPPLSSDCLGICHHTIPQPQSQHELQQTKKSFRNRTQQPGENPQEHPQEHLQEHLQPSQPVG